MKANIINPIIDIYQKLDMILSMRFSKTPWINSPKKNSYNNLISYKLKKLIDNLNLIKNYNLKKNLQGKFIIKKIIFIIMK